MIDYASSRQPPDNRIQWRQADALALPFENSSFDLVYCQFGAMFFPNRVAGYREAKRVLKPGGHFLFSVWDRIEDKVFADDVTNALARIFPDNPPRFLARTPHGYYDTALIRRDVEDAGFSHINIETRAEQSSAASPRIPAIAYCQGTPLRNEIEAREAGKLEYATDEAAAAIAERHGDGEIAAKIQAHVILVAVE
jgi:SAM-dependent methyltransferase